jgi:AcrR family transcriptional regulator
MENPSLGLRERKKLKTREELEATAMRLFAERGFQATTIDNIVSAIEVSKRTFFRYFDSKEAVVLSWIENINQRLIEDFLAAPGDIPPLRSLSEIFCKQAVTFEGEVDRLLALTKLFVESPDLRGAHHTIERSLQDRLTRCVADRLGLDPTNDIRPHLTTGIAFCAKNSAFQLWIASPKERKLSELIKDGFMLIKEIE